MKLEREVRHKSEDIDDEVVLDVIRAMRRCARVVSRLSLEARSARADAD